MKLLLQLLLSHKESGQWSKLLVSDYVSVRNCTSIHRSCVAKYAAGFSCNLSLKLHVSCNAASPFSVLKIFESFEEKFIQCVHAKYNVLRLKRKKVIPPDIVTKIESVNDAEAVEILYDHLKHHGTVDTLMEYCEVASEADGYPNMQSLARKMKDLLEGIG